MTKNKVENTKSRHGYITKPILMSIKYEKKSLKGASSPYVLNMTADQKNR